MGDGLLGSEICFLATPQKPRLISPKDTFSEVKVDIRDLASRESHEGLMRVACV